MDKAQLSQRHLALLKAIIQEYTKTGEPVSSDILDKKYNLGVSPATIRNDMTHLAKIGYLKKEHFSSGRIPTAQSFRFYIQNVMKEKTLSTSEEVSYKNDVWDFKNELHRLLQHATRTLAKKTQLLALTTTSQGDVYYAGVNNILYQKEFWDIDITRGFLELLDEYDFSQRLLSHFDRIEQDLLFMLGEEKDNDLQIDECASVFGEFHGNTIKGAIGVMGSKRMHYDEIVPSVRYFTSLIEGIIKEQGL
jgi:heat-inducible transcriptional repressor